MAMVVCMLTVEVMVMNDDNSNDDNDDDDDIDDSYNKNVNNTITIMDILPLKLHQNLDLEYLF